MKNILVTGGTGYVGCVLVPQLLANGYHVTVYDILFFGREGLPQHPNLSVVEGDIRDTASVSRAFRSIDTVLHLACISNDPSFELDPTLGKSINFDCFPSMVDASIAAGVERFVYASSSSVYGVKETENVTEELPLEPLTDYSKYKAMCEDVLNEAREPGFTVLTLRPATVCGYSPRLRLDLSVNILTNLAVNKRRITVFGGEQKRPNIHIQDVCDLYVKSLEWPAEQIDGKVYNAGWDNLSINEIAETVKRIVGPDVEIVRTETNDKRSYHISSDKIRRELGFAPKRSIADAVKDLVAAFKEGQIPNPDDIRYFNIKTMQALKMK